MVIRTLITKFRNIPAPNPNAKGSEAVSFLGAKHI